MTGHRTREADDCGSYTLSTAIVVPTIILVLAVTIMAGRIAIANGAVESAANEAARAASISRTHSDADTVARATAATTLSSANTTCTNLNVSTSLAGLGAPLGQPGEVSVTVACTVRLADLPVLGEADRTITYTATSVVDPYRSR